MEKAVFWGDLTTEQKILRRATDFRVTDYQRHYLPKFEEEKEISIISAKIAYLFEGISSKRKTIMEPLLRKLRAVLFEDGVLDKYLNTVECPKCRAKTEPCAGSKKPHKEKQLEALNLWLLEHEPLYDKYCEVRARELEPRKEREPEPPKKQKEKPGGTQLGLF
jgi:hypothetical protein